MNTFHDLNRRMEAAVHPDADTEVPHMTSDIYYGFDSRDFRASLEKPDAPIRGRQFRSTYAMADGGLAIANGPGFFNRPLYTPGCIGFASTDRNQHYDAGCGPCGGRLDWDEPHLAENDTVEFRDGLTILRDPDASANWGAVGSTPGGSFLAIELPEGTHFEIAFTVAATAAADAPPAPLTEQSLRECATQAMTPERTAVFEPVPLEGIPPVPFADAFKLFPGEQLFQFNYPDPDDKPLRFMLDARFDEKPAELRVTRSGIPFRFDPAQVVAFKSKHDDKGHVFKPVPLYALDFEVPETLTVPVGKPAAAVWLLASGLHTVMTCHLPQIEIALEYADGCVIRRRLTAPDEFDFILQHTTTHPSVAIGWFGTDEELRTLEQERVASGDPLFRITRRLHADVIRLDGGDGLLERIVFTPLQRHSGMLLYGVTLEQQSRGDVATAGRG
jgi:hypothetical protein